MIKHGRIQDGLASFAPTIPSNTVGSTSQRANAIRPYDFFLARRFSGQVSHDIR